MSERIKSAWKFTWDSGGVNLVLLDYGDFMLAEPTLPQQHEVQAQPFLRAAYRKTWDRGGVGYEMDFSKVSEFTTPQALRNYALTHSIAIAELRHATLKIEVENGNVYELLDASITGTAPNLNKDLVKFSQLAFTYRVSGGELVDVTP